MPTTGKDKTRLEELEVQEVSVVDRPANQRRFLIVKRQEDDMPRQARPSDERDDIQKGAPSDDDGALALLLDLDDLGAGDDPPEVDDKGDDKGDDGGDPSFQQIFKAENAGAALKVAQAALQKLMGAVNAIKKLGEGAQPSPAILNVLRGVSGALGLMAGGKGEGDGEGDDADKKKAAGDMLGQVTKAMERLMALVNKLKEMDASAEVPAAIMTEAKAIAALLQGAMPAEVDDSKGDDKGDADKKKTTTTKMEIFVPKDGETGDDPEIIIKAGAKMKRTRLSKLKQAVKLLTEVLTEISPEDKKDSKGTDKDKKKEKVKKADDDKDESTLEAAVASVAETVKKLGEKVDDISKTVKDSLGEVTKRVATLEGEPPAPTETDDDGATPVKKGDEQSKSIFHNVVHQ